MGVMALVEMMLFQDFHCKFLRSFLGIHHQVVQEVVSHFGQSLLVPSYQLHNVIGVKYDIEISWIFRYPIFHRSFWLLNIWFLGIWSYILFSNFGILGNTFRLPFRSIASARLRVARSSVSRHPAIGFGAFHCDTLYKSEFCIREDDSYISLIIVIWCSMLGGMMLRGRKGQRGRL